jgi:hypothetical protein
MRRLASEILEYDRGAEVDAAVVGGRFPLRASVLEALALVIGRARANAPGARRVTAAAFRAAVAAICAAGALSVHSSPVAPGLPAADAMPEVARVPAGTPDGRGTANAAERDAGPDGAPQESQGRTEATPVLLLRLPVVAVRADTWQPPPTAVSPFARDNPYGHATAGSQARPTLGPPFARENPYGQATPSEQPPPTRGPPFARENPYGQATPSEQTPPTQGSPFARDNPYGPATPVETKPPDALEASRE